jgi:hypothetical protein
VFSKKKHVCPNRSNKITTTNNNTNNSGNLNRQSFYSKKPWINNKPKMSNSLELLQGSIADVQNKYEFLSDIVSEANGKVHGSQSHIVNANVISLIVYYEVSEGQRDQIKQKFNFTSKKQITLHQQRI